MKNLKNKLFLATAILAFAACSENTYLGDQEGSAQGNGAISFNSNLPALTRAGGTLTDAEKLKYSFAVYATKTTPDGSDSDTEPDVSNVFAQNAYASPNATSGHEPYWVWYNTSTANTTTSNTNNWEYVGETRNKNIPNGTFTLGKAQSIKYWDYSANKYEFVAYKATEGNPTITNYNIIGFTVAASAAQLAGLYIADKITINSANNTPSTPGTLPSDGITKIGDVVQFTFRAAGTKVRLGIYETIPGYDVKNVNFRPNSTSDPEFSATTANAKLSGSFNGTSSAASGTYNVTYNATSGIAEFDNQAASANKYFDFGTFASASTALGTSSTAPTWASGNAAYQGVLPNTDNVNNMILYVDYDLINTASGETIHVKGAKAVVPAAYMTWKPNYAYTYLFKINDNTNGTTGTEGTSPEGLFPITFDAVTVATTDGAEVGTITTISTPAITTYQEGSVSATGITYANANGPIYITVNTDGTLATLTADNTKLYTVDAGTTEADLILTTKTKTSSGLLSVLGADVTSQGITFKSGKAATFTPDASTTYALEYRQIDAVSGATGNPAEQGYYERSGDNAPYTYTKTTDTTVDSEKTYYTVVPQYKIIIVN